MPQGPVLTVKEVVMQQQRRTLALLLFCSFLATQAGGCRRAGDGRPSGSAGTVTYPAPTEQHGPEWRTVSYRQIVDTNALTHSGQTVAACLNQDPLPRNEVQPFVDKFSALLPYVLAKEKGDQGPPQRNIVDLYPPGSPQPAWVAIFRGGRICLTTDFRGHAQLFLYVQEDNDASDPEKAYQERYPIVRHCLSSLLPPNGNGLDLEVYAYQNDYKSSRIKLNLTPYKLHQTRFGPPEGKKEIDLDALARFFQRGDALEGASISKDGELILYAKQGEHPQIGGAPVALSDLAVAYRAAFHAGDNPPYISLDANPDPTKVNANFGGFLEDTRVGLVVLEADKRFKTLASGLDPNTLADIRESVGRMVPDFMMTDERALLTKEKVERGWVGTRLWFYPNSVRVEADRGAHLGRVSKPIFEADAERSRDDFKSPEEFERRKQSTLSPSIRAAIDDLNRRYDVYARRFGELRDLKNVARLFGICRWLKAESAASKLDLDALLAVELPRVSTPRVRDQLVSFEAFKVSRNSRPTIRNLRDDSYILACNSLLNRRLHEVFPTQHEYRDILRRLSWTSVTGSVSLTGRRSVHPGGRTRVRQLACTKHDLETIALHLGHTTILKTPKEKRCEKELARLQKAIQAWGQQPGTDSGIVTVKSQRDAFLSDARRLESACGEPTHNHTFTTIQGGIDLDPDHIALESEATSARLKEFSQIYERIRPNETPLKGLGTWIRSEAGRSVRAPLRAQAVEAEVARITRGGASNIYSGSTVDVSLDESRLYVASPRPEAEIKPVVAVRRPDGWYEFRWPSSKEVAQVEQERRLYAEFISTARQNRVLSGDAAISIRRLDASTYLLASADMHVPLRASSQTSVLEGIVRIAKSRPPNRGESLALYAEGFPQENYVGLSRSVELQLKNEGLDLDVVSVRKAGSASGGASNGGGGRQGGGRGGVGSGSAGQHGAGGNGEEPPNGSGGGHYGHGEENPGDGGPDARGTAGGGGRRNFRGRRGGSASQEEWRDDYLLLAAKERRNVRVEAPSQLERVADGYEASYKVHGELRVQGRGRWQTFKAEVRVVFREAVSKLKLEQVRAVIERVLTAVGDRISTARAAARIKRELRALEPGASVEVILRPLNRQGADIQVGRRDGGGWRSKELDRLRQWVAHNG